MNPKQTDHLSQEAISSQLARLAQDMHQTSLSTLICQPQRENLCFTFQDMCADCTRQPIDDKVLKTLLDLAEACQLSMLIDDMFSGKFVNVTENRPVSHTDLRLPERQESPEFKKCVQFVEQLRDQRPFSSIVNLGIGGSDLGPAMVTEALAGYHDGPETYFVGNIDPSDLSDVLQKCDARSTLFIVTSKTFTTAETLTNAQLAKDWLIKHGVNPKESMCAVTAYRKAAEDWGISKDQIFSFDEGVGGRYSLWSAVGLPIMTAVGIERFCELLAGAYAMDTHFRTAPFDQNLPVIMGLLRVWHRSYLHRPAYGLMPYDQRLSQFPAWAQQLEMESNGKSVDRHGQPLNTPAGPLIWGAAGTNSQHSFFQWLHQAVDVTPIDILIATAPATLDKQSPFYASHQMLAFNAVAQAEALAFGSENKKQPHRHFSGNRPSVLLSWDKTTPYALGRLLALYEHITVV